MELQLIHNIPVNIQENTAIQNIGVTPDVDEVFNVAIISPAITTYTIATALTQLLVCHSRCRWCNISKRRL